MRSNVSKGEPDLLTSTIGEPVGKSHGFTYGVGPTGYWYCRGMSLSLLGVIVGDSG